MSLLGDSGIYTVKLESAELPDQANLIQYYLEATDIVGNRALQGFAFDPLERLLVSESVAAVPPASEPFVSGSLSLTRKVIYGAVGLLLVGVLAAASGGGGSGSSAGVPVTVVVDQLP